jgi:tetratricopeptide (TPR) repeat protein
LLERTVAANPAYADAHFELGIAYRKSSAYDKSAEQLEKAVEPEGGNARYCRELGVTYSKSHRIGEAINHLKRAVDLDPKDREAWSNLGGALRRDGTRNAPGEFDVPVLKEARECYNRAAQLDKYDLYAALNVCRLDLLLATWEPNKFQEAIKGFADRLPLCQYQAQLDPDDAWRQFDLAEALLFAGSKAEAKEAFIKAIKSTPSAEQQSIFGSVREPLAGYLISDGIPPKTKNQIREILELFHH